MRVMGEKKAKESMVADLYENVKTRIRGKRDK